MLSISVTIHHMIVIYGTLIFRVVRGGGSKSARNGQK